MRIPTVVVRPISVGVLLVVCSATLSLKSAIGQVQAGAAHDNPMTGTWKLNVSKSKYDPGPAPKSINSTMEETKDGLTTTAQIVDADGKARTVHYEAKFDGKEYPLTGSPDYDAVVAKRINRRTIEITRKKGGTVVQTARYVVSKDGKKITLTATGTNAKGQKINNVTVLKKR
jgi:hypothetical protein